MAKANATNELLKMADHHYEVVRHLRERAEYLNSVADFLEENADKLSEQSAAEHFDRNGKK